MLNTKKYPNPEEILPHDKPMSLLNKIRKFEPDENFIEAVASFSKENFFYQGHFSGNPVTPGVILLETMFQTSGLYLSLLQESSDSFSPILGRAVKVKNASFMKEVHPNEEMIITAKYKQKIMSFFVFDCQITVKEEIVCKSKIIIS